MDRALAIIRQELASAARGQRSGLRRLTPRHCQAIAMYCDGKGKAEIARVCKRSEGWVAALLKDPASRPIIDGLMADLDMEFRGLYAYVIRAVSNGLRSADTEIAMKAADQWLKVHGKFAKREDDERRPLTAEDIVQQLLNQSREGNPASVTIAVTGGSSPLELSAPPIVEAQQWVEVGEEEEPEF